MKLTFSIICEKIIEILDTQAVFMRFCEENTEINGIGSTNEGSFSGSSVYLLDKTNGAFPANCIMRGGEKLIACIPPESSVLILPESISEERISAALNRCFAFYSRWENEVLEAVGSGADWYELIEKAHGLLKNPMIIYDLSMKVLAYTKTDGSEDKIWQDTVKAGTASIQNTEESDELLKYVRRFEADNRPFKHQGEGMSDPFYSCNILVQKQRRGMVTLMEHNHVITPGETDLLRIFSSLLSFKLLAEHDNAPSKEDIYRDLLVDLLEGNIEGQHRLNTRLLAAGWNTDKYFAVMQFSQSLSYYSGAKWKAAVDDFERMGMDGICCVMNEPNPAICAISSLKSAEHLLRVRRRIDEYCRVNHLRCGISDLFEDLISVPRYWDQAVSALELGEDTVNEYSTVRRGKLLEYLGEHPFPEDIQSSAVITLRAIDRQSGTEYCRTLRELCRSMFSQTEAAQKLDIHRTTLSYRLQKIAELTGLDINDHEKMLHAWLSLEISR